ncbi:MAG TPA: hypothetical protein VNA24_30650 [Hyalangium sp.]|nr:hypothetical protein [Hyalangium sp.]
MGTGPVGKGPSQPQLAKVVTDVAVGVAFAAATKTLAKAAGTAAKAAPRKVTDGFEAPPSLKPDAHGINKKGGPLHSSGGKISGADWADPASLVSKLTQNPSGKLRAQSGAACSAANLIGAALLSGGPDKAAALLDRVSKDGSLNLGPAEQKQLNDIAGKIRNRTATFEDMNLAQELVYRAGNTKASAMDLMEQALSSNKLSPSEKKQMSILAKDGSDPQKLEKLLSKGLGREVHLDHGWEKITDKARTRDTSGLTDDELMSLGTAAAPGARTQELTGHDTIESLANALKPGEALTIRVAGNDDDNARADHYVTVGRQKDGTFYLYNPDPAKDDATLVTGGKGPQADADFLKRTEQYNMRMVDDLNTGTLPPGLRYSP